MFRRGTKRPRFSVGGHSMFEPDESSNHSYVGIVDYDDDSLSQHHTTSNNSSDQHFSSSQAPGDRPRRVQRPMSKSHHDDNINLNACLDHLLRIVSRKDKEGFFQHPVTDQLAPGYSQIITRPMDFSTMKKKIVQDDYSNIVEFRSDFELMCDNAMKYNRPETIYWQAAKKLLATGTKLMNKDKLLSSRRSVECFSRLTERELGFRIDSSSHQTIDESPINHLNESLDSSIIDQNNLSSISISQACSQRKPKLILKLPKYYEKPVTIVSDQEDEEVEEEYSPEEILSQARQAAQCARDKLHRHHPLLSYTLSYQRDNGTSSLRFINQDDLTQQTIALTESSYLSSTIVSTLPIGTDSDQRHYSSARDFLDRGPFSSHASQNESAFASTSKDELDLLIHTYGSEFSAQYAVSLMDYVEDTGDLALAYVDRFLSVLTNGEHDNFMMKKREKQKIKEEIVQKNDELTQSSTVAPNESIPISLSHSIKLEPQINTADIDTNVDENSKLFLEPRPTPYAHLCEPMEKLDSLIPVQQQSNDSIQDYDFADTTDLTHLTNESEQLISSESIHPNLSLMNNNLTTFGSF